jgi:hypothetical protein
VYPGNARDFRLSLFARARLSPPEVRSHYECLDVIALAKGWDMARPKRTDAEDSALPSFYEACGLGPKTIERALELIYYKPLRTFPPRSDFHKRIRREAVEPKKRKAK